MGGSVLKISQLNIQRVLLVCATALAAGLLLTASGVHGQSPALMDAYERFQALSAQGRYEEAVPFAEQALRLGEREFGPDHATTASLLNNLGALYRAQGRYAEAEPLVERALAIFENALGPDHPNVATALKNYAALLRGTGRSEDAMEMEARAKAIRAKHAEENP